MCSTHKCNAFSILIGHFCSLRNSIKSSTNFFFFIISWVDGSFLIYFSASSTYTFLSSLTQEHLPFPLKKALTRLFSISKLSASPYLYFVIAIGQKDYLKADIVITWINTVTHTMTQMESLDKRISHIQNIRYYSMVILSHSTHAF